MLSKRLDVREFTLTEDHLKLLGRSYFEWDDAAYEGAVAQGLKRPYGNSDVLGDLYEIIVDSDGWDYDGPSEEMPDDVQDRLLKIHREMELVVQILALSAGHGFPFEVGRTYARARHYDALSWRPKEW